MFEDVPAPKRLAPYATAIAAAVRRDDADVAWGRLVLLYDPDGQQGWEGVFRLVAYIRAEVDQEMAADPLLGQVGWSWLSEALDAHVPGYAVPSGTVTRVITEGFGGKQDESPLSGFELRASWSPVGSEAPEGLDEAAAATAADRSERGRPTPSWRTSRPGVTACLPRPAWNRQEREHCASRGTGERRQGEGPVGHQGSVPLLEPRDGLPPVVETGEALAEITARLASGEGPVAVDAERASGYRYGQRAYLVQLRRAGAGHGSHRPDRLPRPFWRRRRP